jgi:hypothetical protein
LLKVLPILVQSQSATLVVQERWPWTWPTYLQHFTLSFHLGLYSL